MKLCQRMKRISNCYQKLNGNLAMKKLLRLSETGKKTIFIKDQKSKRKKRNFYILRRLFWLETIDVSVLADGDEMLLVFVSLDKTEVSLRLSWDGEIRWGHKNVTITSGQSFTPTLLTITKHTTQHNIIITCRCCEIFKPQRRRRRKYWSNLPSRTWVPAW